MRLLIVNKFWYRRGGLERLVFDEVDWLTAAGHEVSHFACDHPRNEPSPYGEYFAPYLELGTEGDLTTAEEVLAAARMFHNAAAARGFARLLDAARPDVVHVHGIHRQLSTSILRAARERGVPVVMTVHDYNPICPADLLVRGDGSVCWPPRCTRYDLTPCVTYACMRGRKGVSLLAAAELFWRRWVAHCQRLVAEFVTPSRFLADAMRRRGWGDGAMTLIPNAVQLPAPAADGDGGGDYFLFAGRVSREKGAHTIVAAAERAGVRLVVAGEGPLREELVRRRPTGVEFLGEVEVSEVWRRLDDALALCVPSEWCENASISALEGLAVGRPVIASRIGGLPELVRDGVDGILVEPGDVEGFAAALKRVAGDRDEARRMGAAGRRRAATEFAPAKHVEQLEAVYRRVVGGGEA